MQAIFPNTERYFTWRSRRTVRWW